MRKEKIKRDLEIIENNMSNIVTIENITIKVGDYFWEYNNGVGYKRKAHSEEHIKYFWEGYMTRAFFTVDELLSVYPNAIVD